MIKNYGKASGTKWRSVGGRKYFAPFPMGRAYFNFDEMAFHDSKREIMIIY